MPPKSSAQLFGGRLLKGEEGLPIVVFGEVVRKERSGVSARFDWFPPRRHVDLIQCLAPLSAVALRASADNILPCM
jgi:hypothetical protein